MEDVTVTADLLQARPGSHGEVAGPWTSGFFCVLPPVRSKSNDRALDRSATARSARARQEAFDVQACQMLKVARPASWCRPDRSLRKVDRRPQVLSLIVACSTVDVGNLSKSILDVGQQAGLYQTDATVRADLSLGPARSRDGSSTVTVFVQLDADADALEQAEASRALLDWWIGQLQAR